MPQREIQAKKKQPTKNKIIKKVKTRGAGMRPRVFYVIILQMHKLFSFKSLTFLKIYCTIELIEKIISRIDEKSVEIISFINH